MIAIRPISIVRSHQRDAAGNRPARLVNMILVATLLLASGLTLATPARAQTPTPIKPPGFVPIDSDLGVQLYKKDYPNGNPDYVQVIDLSQGARLELLHGEITDARPDKGVYGGADPRMTSLPLQTYWDRIRVSEPDAFCITNGQFFYMPEYPTRLAFPLKVKGEMVTDGWGIKTYVDQKRMLELWEDHAEIRELSLETLTGSTAPDLIGGLTEEANKRAKYSVGRTFVGVDDRDGDGLSEIVLVFNTLSALQSAAAATLRSFGADQVMMLDGGGSTQLLCQSGWHIRSDRPIPQAIAIIAATPPPISSELISHPSWTVTVEGEPLELDFEVKNTGVVSWTNPATNFYLHTQRLEFEERFYPQSETLPGATAAFSQTLVGYSQSGIHPTHVEWGIEYEGELYPGQPIELKAIVLPFRLQESKEELIQQVEQWAGQPEVDLEQKVQEWIERRMANEIQALEAPGMQQVRPNDALWVPMIMLPIAALIALMIYTIRR